MPRKPKEPPPPPGTVLRLHRESLGWTQAELGDKLGVPKTRISDVERGTKRPTLDWWWSAADKLGVDPSTFDRRLASTTA